MDIVVAAIAFWAVEARCGGGNGIVADIAFGGEGKGGVVAEVGDCGGFEDGGAGREGISCGFMS